MKRGQASYEYIVLVGLLLVLLTSIFYFAANRSSENIKMTQAEDAVKSLAKAADDVYSLSPGSKKFVWISIPGGVQESIVTGSQLILKISIFDGVSDITALSRATLAGSFPSAKGTYRIPLELLESGIVYIGSGNDTSPPSVTWTSPSGLTCNPIIARANTDEPAICKLDAFDLSFEDLALEMSGNSIGHSYNLGVQEEGNHAYYVRCRDVFNNTMLSSASVNYTINLTLCSQTVEETDPPIVQLINPPSGYVSNSPQIDFFYNVSDASAILECRLYAEEVVVGTAANPLRDTTNNIAGNLEFGNYTWQINCTDSSGNVGNSSTREIEVNATLDSDLPIVIIESPLNGSIRNFNLVKFFYNVSDLTSTIYSCTLNLVGELDGGGTTTQEVTDYSVTEDEQEQLSLSLDQGNYTWNVSCKDNSIYRNIGFSSSWWVRVNSTTEESFINSCAGLCGYEGYSNGACENNPSKCGEYCPNCYLPEGDQYCLGGSQSDTCCCQP